MGAGKHRIGGSSGAGASARSAASVGVFARWRRARQRVAGTSASARRTGRGPSRGVTLVELLAVVAILAILATMAAPTFGSLRRTAGVGAAATELLAALHFARSAATLDGQPVTLCLSADGQTCVPSSTDAAKGWLVFAQPGAGVTASTAVVPPVLRHFQVTDGVVVHGSRAVVTFWPAARASLTSTFDVCDERGEVAGRAVVVSQTGRPRIEVAGASC
jgi:type IV fimbrial biogenesis protein FimT